MKPAIGSIIAASGCLCISQLAQAHAKLLSAAPPIGGVSKAAPRMLALHFSEAISAKLSGAVVTGADGKPLAIKASADHAGKSLSLVPGAPLRPGVYRVDWHAVASDDGHRTSGTYSFTVR